MQSYWLGPNNEVSNAHNDSTDSIPAIDDEAVDIEEEEDRSLSYQDDHHELNSNGIDDEDVSSTMSGGTPTVTNSYMNNILKSRHLSALIVSYWDNNVGPKPMKVWNGRVSRHEYLTDDNLLFISRFSMMDDMPRYEEIKNNVEIKFNIMSDIKAMVFTAVFCSKNWEKGNMKTSFFRRKADPPPTLFTISLVMNRDNLSRFMAINFIVKEKMLTLARILQHFADTYMNVNEAAVLTNFETHLFEFTQLYDSLCRTVFEPPTFNLYHTLFNDKLALKKLFEKEEENLFLQRAITSHLETHGYSVIVGQHLEEVNVWVNTLAMFLSQQEKQLIRHAQKVKKSSTQPQNISSPSSTSFFKSKTPPVAKVQLDPKNVFKPEIFVQGLLLTPNISHWKELIPTKCLLSGSYPITVIDLKERKVYAFKKYHYFQAFKRDYFEESESKNILNDFGIQTTPGDKQFRDHYFESRRICTSIQELFYVILRVMPLTVYPAMRCSLISEFVRLLHRKAIALAKYVQSMRNIENMESAKIQKILMKHVMINNSVQKYHSQDLTSELFVIMAAAEKLQHGVYTLITGDPQTEAHNVVDFLDSTMVF